MWEPKWVLKEICAAPHATNNTKIVHNHDFAASIPSRQNLKPKSDLKEPSLQIGNQRICEKMVRPTGVYYPSRSSTLVWLAVRKRQRVSAASAKFLASKIGLKADGNPLPALTNKRIRGANMAKRLLTGEPAQIEGKYVRGSGCTVAGTLHHDWAYIVGTAVGEPFKVGKTHNLDNRMNNLQAGNHRRLIVHLAVESERARDTEYNWFEEFSDHRLVGEWFEWNAAVEEIISKITGGCTRTMKRFGCTGHIRTGNVFANYTGKIANVNRSIAAYHAKKGSGDV